MKLLILTTLKRERGKAKHFGEGRRERKLMSRIREREICGKKMSMCNVFDL